MQNYINNLYNREEDLIQKKA